MTKQQMVGQHDDRTLPLDLAGLSGLGTSREPSAREMNRRIREENSAIKRQEKRVATGTGAGLGVLDRAQKRHPNNPKAQLAMFMREFVIRSGTGRSRPVSDRTNDTYVEGLMLMIDELRLERMAIQNLGEIGKSHAIRLIKYWMAQGQSSGTIQNKISILRRFLSFIGKENIIPKGHDLRAWLNQEGIQAPTWRQTVATESLAWDQNDVDFHEVLEKLRFNCQITAMHLELQAAFGLRVKESIQLRPTSANEGNLLRVIHGTKGGLPRDIHFEDTPGIREWQRDVLERAKLFAGRNRRGTVSDQHRTLDQSKRHFYYQVGKVGITRNELGVTAHGLRHQYAARRYTAISGMAPPVHSDAPVHVTQATRDSDLQARQQVSQELGHFRPDVTQAYTGSLPMMERSRLRRMKDWLQRTEENSAFQSCIRAAGINAVWLGGEFALGLEVSAQKKLRLIVSTTNRLPMEPNARFLLKQSLLDIYSRGVDLSEHFEQSPPDDGLEINLHWSQP